MKINVNFWIWIGIYDNEMGEGSLRFEKSIWKRKFLIYTSPRFYKL